MEESLATYHNLPEADNLTAAIPFLSGDSIMDWNLGEDEEVPNAESGLMFERKMEAALENSNAGSNLTKMECLLAVNKVSNQSLR